MRDDANLRSPWLTEHAFEAPLTIGLVSDTHVPEARRTLWDELYATLEGVDLILHGGDMHDIVVLDWLERVAPVLAARGNGDDGSSGRPIAPDDPRLAHNQLLHIARAGGASLRLGMTHDFPEIAYVGGATTAQRMERCFGGRVDIVVAGDTHVPVVTTVDGVLIVNSGSPTYPRNLQTQLGTVGFLHIPAEGDVDAWIEQLH